MYVCKAHYANDAKGRLLHKSKRCTLIKNLSYRQKNKNANLPDFKKYIHYYLKSL